MNFCKTVPSRVPTGRTFVFGMAGLLMFVMPCRAHDPGLSSVSIYLAPPAFNAIVTLARADVEMLAPLDTERNGSVTAQHVEAKRPPLEQLGKALLEVDCAGQRLETDKVGVKFDSSGAVHFRLSYPLADHGKLQVRSAWLGRLPRGHRQYVSVRDEHGSLLVERVLEANNNWIEADIVPTNSSSSFRQFLWLGVEHIVTGYDHLVFLLGLLIAGGNFRAAARIITAFTLAHSITLALVTLRVLRFPLPFVEPLIAVSIIYVGLENIVRRELEGRWPLAFLFGLIHGCGFASALCEAGLGANGTGVALPLFSFNLGVELGQLALAALVVPLVWFLKRRPYFKLRCVPACSILIVLAGGYWLAERLLPAIGR